MLQLLDEMLEKEGITQSLSQQSLGNEPVQLDQFPTHVAANVQMTRSKMKDHIKEYLLYEDEADD